MKKYTLLLLLSFSYLYCFPQSFVGQSKKEILNTIDLRHHKNKIVYLGTNKLDFSNYDFISDFFEIYYFDSNNYCSRYVFQTSNNRLLDLLKICNKNYSQVNDSTWVDKSNRISYTLRKEVIPGCFAMIDDYIK